MAATMISFSTCLLALVHLSSSAVVPQESQNKARGNNYTVYYYQRDGRLMKEAPGTAVRTDVTHQALSNNPAPGMSREALAFNAPSPKVTYIHTNALTHLLPNGTRVGDLGHGHIDQLRKVYPFNPIMAESPATMTKTEIRPSLSIDQVIQKTENIHGPRAVHYPSPSGTLIMELDMNMTQAQYMYYYEGRRFVSRPPVRSRTGRRMKRKALKFEFTYWPHAEIPYTIDNSFSAAERRLLGQCMQDWMDRSCINFIPAGRRHTDYLSIQNGKGCNSFVGRIGGSQTLNLEPACREFHVMKHELGHVIGLIHEHQRPDRDNYITVERANVGNGRMKNYKKFLTSTINNYNVDYDYTSIMHYGKTAFSKDDYSTTMVTRDPNFQDIIGTTSKVSYKDAKIVNAMYKCADHCNPKPYCQGGFTDKNCQCVCPDGTQRCSRRPVVPPQIWGRQRPNFQTIRIPSQHRRDFRGGGIQQILNPPSRTRQRLSPRILRYLQMIRASVGQNTGNGFRMWSNGQREEPRIQERNRERLYEPDPFYNQNGAYMEQYDTQTIP